MKEYHVSYMCIFSTVVEAESPEEAAEIAASECEYDIDGEAHVTELAEDEDSLSYYRIDCNNGFCGCEETFYVALPQDVDIDEYAQEVLENQYSFYEPDGRFIPNKSWGDDITEEEYDDYMEDVGATWEEITREEYENHE